jgi:hypothetical protein
MKSYKKESKQMDDLTYDLENVRVIKLIADVQHKFSVFSISNTLFPKNKISTSELKYFFTKVAKNIYMILNAPTGVITKIFDNKITTESYIVTTMNAKNLDELADSLNKFIKQCEVIGFYDLNYDPIIQRYNIRLHVFEDDLRLKAFKRDQKIDKLLDE